MIKYIVQGGTKLSGSVTISGAKNAAVAILPATLLVSGPCRIENVPDISDVRLLLEILRDMGAEIRRYGRNTLEIDCTRARNATAPIELVRRIRASYYLIGAELGRFGHAHVAMPGGCNFGVRPIDHIDNIVRPVSAAPAAKNVIFLSADAFGVLPPVSILTPEQTQYYFLSGFTAKLAGTERGITEPTPTFSACFGQAFLELHPTKYAEELVKKMKASGAKAYLVNTGWNGTGKRISIKDTRGIIDAILSGAINTAPTKTIPVFGFEVPTELPGVDPAILDPRDTYANVADWEAKAADLAGRFVKNFAKYEGNEAGKALVAAGPKA